MRYKWLILSGFLAGSLGTTMASAGSIPPATNQPAHALYIMQAKLALTPAQVKAITASYKKLMASMQSIWHTSSTTIEQKLASSEEARAENRKRIDALLTPVQLEQMNVLRADTEDREWKYF